MKETAKFLLHLHRIEAVVGGVKLPDAADLAGAGLALARLQLVYRLDPAHLARGQSSAILILSES